MFVTFIETTTHGILYMGNSSAIPCK